jgi:hypothetical protein
MELVGYDDGIQQADEKLPPLNNQRLDKPSLYLKVL